MAIAAAPFEKLQVARPFCRKTRSCPYLAWAEPNRSRCSLCAGPSGIVQQATDDLSVNRVIHITEQPLAAPLTKSCDFNADGQIDFSDFLIFANAFGSADSRFDLDADGRVGFGDFLHFARIYEVRSEMP